ncbi:MAG: PCRF domain-containing protein, partial [Oscillospiraceae bacterium]|nr:PCRF domain-containing protein [Oscillospiraceae bacterium]
MLDKLLAMQAHFEEIGEKLSDPAVISDREQYAALMKEHKTLTPIVEAYRRYRAAKDDADEAHVLLEEDDAEL